MMNPTQIQSMRACLLKWKDTPYGAGQDKPGKGGGVDCVRFCDEVLVATLGLEGLPPLPRHPPDSAVHSTSTIQQMVKVFFSRFDLYEVSASEKPLPGDLIMVRQRTQTRIPTEAPSHHVILKTWGPSECYDAWPGIGVRQTSIGAVKSAFRITRIYRSRMLYEA